MRDRTRDSRDAGLRESRIESDKDRGDDGKA